MSKLEVITKPDMTAEESRAGFDAFNNHIIGAGIKGIEMLKELYERNAWKALGYATWKDACEKEINMTTQRARQLLDFQIIRDELALKLVNPPAITERAARELKHVPSDRIAEVVEKAAATARGEGKKTPTHRHIQQAASEHKTQPVVKKLPPEKKSLEDAAYKKALGRIGDICGPSARKAIETGAVKMVRSDVLLFSKQRDNVMGDIQELVLTQRWKVKKAIKFVNKMPDAYTKVCDLINLAIAGGGKWEGTVNQFDIVVTARKKKH